MLLVPRFPLVESVSRALDLAAVALRPIPECGHRLEQRAAERRKEVLHPWGDGRVDRPPNQPVSFQSSKFEKKFTSCASLFLATRSASTRSGHFR